MNALQPPQKRPSRTAAAPRRRGSQSVLRHRQRASHQAIAFEAGAKLAVNVVLAIAAVSALVKLVPYNLAQQNKLEKLRGEVALAQQDVDQLQSDFDRYFDPQQTDRVMLEEGYRMRPNQFRVIWSNPAGNAVPPQPLQEP